MEKNPIVAKIIEEVCEEICDKYCKFRDTDNQDDIDAICDKCPLNRLQ